MNVIIISSGYYGIEEYMKFNEDMHALIVCNPQYCSDHLKKNIKLHFTLNYSAEGLARDILEIGIKFDYLLCIDDKFLDRIGEIIRLTKINSLQLFGEVSRNKYLLKQIMNKYQINNPRFIFFKNYIEVEEHVNKLEFPLIIKPSSSYGSNGVYLVEDKNELLKYSKIIFRQNIYHKKVYADQIGGMIAENYISGEEYAVDIIWNNEKPICQMISSRLHNSIDNMFPDYVYYYDWKLSAEKKEEIYTVAIKLGYAIGICNGATHTEMREKDNNMYVLENAVRPGGGGCMYLLHRYVTRIDYFEYYYNTMVEKRIDKLPKEEKKFNCYCFFFTFANRKHGIVKRVDFNTAVLGEKTEILKIDYLIKEGERILSNELGMRYTIFVYGIVKAESKEDFISEINKVDKACIINMIEDN